MLLRAVFAGISGGATPKRTYLTGVSMGGHVTVLGLHQFPTAFDGGLAFCAAGPELFDFFTGVAAAAEVVTGRQFTSLAALADTTREMLVPYNASGEAAAPVARMAKAALDRGLYLMTHWNVVMVVPPLTVTREEAEEGVAILDDVLSIADEYVA